MEYDFSCLKKIDVAAGLKYSEREDTYAQVLGDFHRFIDKNADHIRRAYETRNQDDYICEVHKLKSSARLIGAEELSSLALSMEQSGRAGDWDAVDKHTPELLRQYYEYKEILSPFAKQRPKAQGNEISAEELKTELAHLRTKLSEYNYDCSMEILGKLDSRVLPERIKTTYDKLHDSVESFEFDEAIDYVNQLL